MTQQETLAREREVFEAHLAEWRESRLGQSVLIKGDEVVGFYPTLEAAFKAGTQRYGLQDFFVKQIHPADAVNVSFYGQKLRSA